MSTANTTPRREHIIDDRLERTRRLVRNVDLLIAVLMLTATLCGAVLLAVLADHWVFKGGLPVFLRVGFLLVVLLGSGLFVYRRILPLFLRSINPVFAAQVLEKGSPSLKNSLINWILLQRERTERGSESRNPLADRMFDGVTQTAAHSLARIPSDQAVNWTIVQRWIFVLVALFTVFTVYALFSPKNLSTSVARLLLPFNDIAAPQSVRFLNVQPGDLTVQQGERLNISVEVVGPSREPVYLIFSTDDGRAVRQAIPMTQPEGVVRFEAPFPPGKQGFVCGVDYWVQRGDSRSAAFRINVRPIAILEVESLTYQYPDYTGQKPETVENSGDIKAVDGTEVRLVARSTVPLERASIVFDNDPKQTLNLSISGEDSRKATALFRLDSDPKSTQPTTIRSYTFRATDKEGFESRRSGIYRIEILPDRPPSVRWDDEESRLKDDAEIITLPLNAALELPFFAEDPDFGLRFLRFCVESGNKRIQPVELLDSPSMGPTKHKGPLRTKTVFQPTKSRLSVGDSAEIWIEAVDTKLPNPNTASTRRVSVRIGDPKEQEEKQPPKKEEEQKKDDSKKDEKTEPENPEEETDQKNDPPSEEKGAEKEKNPEERQDKDDKQGERQQKDENEEKSGNENKEKKNESREQNGERQENEQQDPSQEKNDPQSNDENKAGNKDNEEKENGRQENDKQNDKQDKQNGEKKKGKDGEEKPVNPETNPGDAMEKIVDQMKKEGKMPEDKQAGQPDQKKKGDQKKEAGNDKEQEKEKGEEKKKGEENPSDQQKQNQDEKNEQPQQQEKKNDEQKQCSQCNKKDCQGDCQGGEAEQDSQGGNGKKEGGKEGEGSSGEGQKEDGAGSKPSPQNGEQEQQNGEKQGGDDSKQSADSGGGEEKQSEASGGDQQKTDKKGGESGNADQETDDAPSGDEDGSGGQSEQDGESGGSKPGKGNGKSGKESSEGASGDENQSGENPPNGEKKDVPVDSNDKGPRERDDSLDPNSKQRRNEGGDASNPKKSEEKPTDKGRVEQDEQLQPGEPTGDRKETKENAGDDQEGEPTDEQGEPTGEGKSTKSGDEKSGQPGQGKDGKPSQAAKEKGDSKTEGSADSSKDQSKESGGESSQPGAPSQPGKSDAQGAPGGKAGQGTPSVDTETEAANLKYTEKVTNLVLEYLKDQMNEPNPELLKELGWTKDQLREFAEKWKRMAEEGQKAVPGSSDAEAWKEALKSLGLKPEQERKGLRTGRTDFKDKDGATESRRYTPPPSLKKRFQNYTEGIGKE